MGKTETSRRSRLSRFSLKALLVLVTCAAIFLGYQLHRYERGTINEWIDLQVAKSENFPWPTNNQPNPNSAQLFDPSLLVPCPLEISSREQLRLLMKATRWETDPVRRQVVFKIIAEQFPDKAHDCCRQIAAQSKDVHLRQRAIHIIGLFQDKEDVEFLEGFLDSDESSLRVSAIDAIGIVHGNSLSLIHI